MPLVVLDQCLRPSRNARVEYDPWHLFAAELINKCPLSTWKNNSRTVRGVGSMHHVALKAQPEHFRALLAAWQEKHIPYSLHGTPASGSVYVRDPDDILVGHA